MSRVSLVVITRNRRSTLEGSVRHHASSLPEDSSSGLVYVDDASDDGTAGFLRAAVPEATVISLSRNLGPAARNVGAALAHTRYVAFSDDDSWWEPGSLERAADILDDAPAVGLVTGAAYVGPERRPDPINEVLAGSPLPEGDGHGKPVLGFLAFAAVVRREAFLGVGGFPRGLGMGAEESALAMDLATAGWSLAHHPTVRAVHHPGPVGDRAGRQMAMASNAMAISLARRRGVGMIAGVREALRPVSGRRTRLRALASLSGSLPWLARSRRPVSPRVERQKRLLEAAQWPA